MIAGGTGAPIARLRESSCARRPLRAARGARPRLAVVSALLLGACSAGTRSPEGAVHALIEAAADGDRPAAFRLLGPATRTRLAASARRTAELSGQRELPAHEMLAVGWFPPRFHARTVREVSRTGGDHALVEVRGDHDGELERVDCVREQGAWKVELP